MGFTVVFGASCYWIYQTMLYRYGGLAKPFISAGILICCTVMVSRACTLPLFGVLILLTLTAKSFLRRQRYALVGLLPSFGWRLELALSARFTKDFPGITLGVCPGG